MKIFLATAHNSPITPFLTASAYNSISPPIVIVPKPHLPRQRIEK